MNRALQSLRMSRVRAVGVLGCLILTGGLVGGMYANTSVHTVVRTERGFEPQRITIQKGDAVAFVSEGVPFWPASDSHPTHARYAAFDPGRMLDPTETWQFVFDRAGVWAFHDHAAPHFFGVIVVEGATGESIEECLRSYEGTIQPECWEGEVERIVREDGIDGVFPIVREWYMHNPDFQRNCHDVMHRVGESAYQEFTDTGHVLDRPEVAYCGYGFYHGFVEEMLRTTGLARFDDVYDYCLAVKEIRRVPSGYGPCLHGIGHAVFDSLDRATWGNAEGMVKKSTEVCESLFASKGEYERVLCASGVFNALANAYSARTYELSYDTIRENPLELCAAQREEYHWFCAMELGNGFLRDQMWDEETERAFIRELEPPTMRKAVISAYGDSEAKMTIDTVRFEALHALCESFADVDGYDACIEGVVTGLFTLGTPGDEAGIARAFCELLPSPLAHETCGWLPR